MEKIESVPLGIPIEEARCARYDLEVETADPILHPGLHNKYDCSFTPGAICGVHYI